jgi:hypothetical protein
MSEESHSTARRVVLVALPVALLLAVAWWSLAPRPAPPAAPGAGSNAGSNATAAPASTTSPPPLAVDEMLRTLSAAPRLNQTSLAGLREALRALPPTEASQRIREFLTTTNDTPTGLEFKLGSDGRLSGAPTLRTFLLEQLDQLDPAGAAAFARTLLQNPTSPDEWALALRSLARGETDPDARRMAAEKLQTMLTREAWQRQPSIGFLEAFDVAVHLRDPALVPTLTQLVQLKDNQAVAHAAYLALDRLTITAPASTLAALQAAPKACAAEKSPARTISREPMSGMKPSAPCSKVICCNPISAPKNWPSSPGFIPTPTTWFPTTC